MITISKIWRFISTVGVDKDTEPHAARLIILSNKINASLFVAMFVVSAVLLVTRITSNSSMTIGSIRVLMVLFVSALIFILSYYQHFNLSKALLIVMPPLILMVFPTLVGFVEEESFIYYGLCVVAFSLIPQLILNHREHPKFYWSSLLYYFVLLVGIYYLMVFYTPVNFSIIEVFKKTNVFVLSAVIVSFWFISISLFYLKNLNQEYESQLNANNKELVEKSNELEDKNRMLDVHIEELQSINEHLRVTQEQLIHQEKMASLGVLIAGVAHEINTPLNFIGTGSLLLQNAIEDIESKNCNNSECLKELGQGQEIIAQGIDRVSKIVTSLMTFAYSGKPVRKQYSLTDIIDSTLLFVQQNMGVDVELVKDYRYKKDVFVFADKIHQIMINLIGNAIYEVKKTPEGQPKRIVLSTSTRKNKFDEMVLVSVYNTGNPVPLEVSAKIFDPFFTTKPPGEGTGLGLSTSLNLAKEHQGTIYFNNINKGVEFVLEIPA